MAAFNKFIFIFLLSGTNAQQTQDIPQSDQEQMELVVLTNGPSETSVDGKEVQEGPIKAQDPEVFAAGATRASTKREMVVPHAARNDPRHSVNVYVLESSRHSSSGKQTATTTAAD